MSAHPWTLRRRLVVATVALLAVVGIVIGTVSVLTLRGYLVDRLDRQVTSATGRSQNALGGMMMGNHGRPAAAGYLALPGQSPGTLGAIISGGQLFNGAVLDESGAPQPLTFEQATSLAALPPDGVPRTIDLGGDLGEYRVAVVDVNATDRLLIGLPLSDMNATVLQLALAVAIVTALGLVTVAFAASFTVRLALRPLDRVVATATSVSELPLDRGDVALAVRVGEKDADPSTEVGRVGASINHMLGHIADALAARQASEDKVRTFVADASHELRTPLASIRGYAELTRRGGHELPPDVVHALGRVESESVRMTSLVEDLLLLARLDEGRDLEKEPVDLGVLVATAVDDARAAGPDHEWAVDVPDTAVVAIGDAARLHQVVANLLANARVHTPAGTRVEASVAAEGDRAVITVRDTGPGIDSALIDSVFERFVRGDGSRSRAAGSTGLGLAIVSAVVEAHGGRTELTSVPGTTEFRVLLPCAIAGAGS
jgi:two-component system OmpR family sensor kinase